MRPPKTDCIFEISIKKYVDKERKINKKIDTRNYRNNSILFYLFILFIYYLAISINCCKQSERLQVSISCSQVVAESGCVTTDCRYRLYFDDR